MAKNWYDGYMTVGCKDCPDWADGTNGRGFGCATRQPIMHCPYFRELCEKNENEIEQEVK